MRATLQTVAALLLLISCATTSGILPMGKDTYVVTGSSEFGIAEAQRAAVDAANKFAAERGKRMIPLTTRSGSERDFLGDSIKNFELQFRIVDESDPEWRRTHVSPIPDTVVEVNHAQPAASKAATEDLYSELVKLRALLDDGTLVRRQKCSDQVV